MKINIKQLFFPKNNNNISYDSIHRLPEEILLNIFQLLKPRDLLNLSLVCRNWRRIAFDTSLSLVHTKECNIMTHLLSQSVKVSPWQTIPKNWTSINIVSNSRSLKFSTIHEKLMAFYPQNYEGSSSFFSFENSFTPPDGYIFLARFEETYFLTPQIQPDAMGKIRAVNLESSMGSNKLAIVNVIQSENLREIDINDISNQGFYSQIKYCFPITENHIVLITATGEVSFWNFSKETANCYKKMQMDISAGVHKMGNKLIFINKIIDLDDLSIIEHDFNFKNNQIITFKSSLCAVKANKSQIEIRYFIINSQGKLEKQWERSENVETGYFLGIPFPLKNQVITFNVTDMDQEFICLTCWQSQAINILILNTQGKVLSLITEELSNVKLENLLQTEFYPFFIQLSGNFLIYKKPQLNTLCFFHIPSMHQLQLPTSFKHLIAEDEFIEDARLMDGKLTILLSKNQKNSDPSLMLRIIQLDLLIKTQKKEKKLLDFFQSKIKKHFV